MLSTDVYSYVFNFHDSVDKDECIKALEKGTHVTDSFAKEVKGAYGEIEKVYVYKDNLYLVEFDWAHTKVTCLKSL
tara:strand:- start:179 stop:406 length:228 start_codon:yes stop_codon:yes gene_type:complete